MTSKPTNASIVNYVSFDELQAEYNAAIAADRRERRNNWIAGVIMFCIIAAIVYFC